VFLNLGTVSIGAFWDDEFSKVLNLPGEYRPLYVSPIGYPE
jgi:nitroreductase